MACASSRVAARCLQRRNPWGSSPGCRRNISTLAVAVRQSSGSQSGAPTLRHPAKRMRNALLNSATHTAAVSVRAKSSLPPPAFLDGGNDTHAGMMAAAVAAACWVAGTAIYHTLATTSSVSPAEAKLTIVSKKHGGPGGGGGGPRRSLLSYFDSSNNRAEKDVKRVQEEAIQNPHLVSVGALQGQRWTMEDEFKVAPGGRFAACFDGHGGNGVSSYLRAHLYDAYLAYLCRKHWEDSGSLENDGSQSTIPSISSHVAALRAALEDVDQQVLENDDINVQGSTAVAVVVHVAKDGRKTLISANVGDSRAVLSRRAKAINLTKDHKPNDPRERERILAQGGDVTWDPVAFVHRVNTLSLSRAIGDRYARPEVISEPDIRLFPVDSSDDEFFILASDGLWDVMSSQEAVDFVHRKLKKDMAHPQQQQLMHDPDIREKITRRKMAKYLANEALLRGSADNVCVVLVWLRGEESR